MLFHLQYSLNSKTTKATPRGPCLAGNSSLVSKPLSHFQVHTQEPEFFSDRSSSTKQWLTAFLGCCSVLKGVTDIGNSALIHSELSFQVFTGQASTQLSTLYSSEGTGRSSGVLSQRPEERVFKLFFSHSMDRADSNHWYLNLSEKKLQKTIQWSKRRQVLRT